MLALFVKILTIVASTKDPQFSADSKYTSLIRLPHLRLSPLYNSPLQPLVDNCINKTSELDNEKSVRYVCT